MKTTKKILNASIKKSLNAYSTAFDQGYFDAYMDIMLHFSNLHKKDDFLTDDVIKEIEFVYKRKYKNIKKVKK